MAEIDSGIIGIVGKNMAIENASPFPPAGCAALCFEPGDL
jgi:hypothetical protein